MKIRTFHIPAIHGEVEAEELNRFLAGTRIRDLERRFVEDGPSSYWAFAVTVVGDRGGSVAASGSGRERIDYKEVLSEAQFAVYSRLRELRKQLSDRDAVPAYAVATNAQLAAMITGSARTAADLARIDGFGDGRLDKYGEALLKVLHEAGSSPGQKSDGSSEGDQNHAAGPSDDRSDRGSAQPG